MSPLRSVPKQRASVALATRGLATLVLASCAFTTSALAHNHLTVDTASGQPGDPIIIRAGYYPTESAYSIVSGRLLLNSQIAVYDLLGPLTQSGEFNNWTAGDDVLLTSDYAFATGRLDGGDFSYEIVKITPVSGGPGRIIWGDFDENGVLTPLADSAGVSRALRSFHVGFGGHDHEQGYALTGGWVQDVTLVAWDVNGKFADSQEVTLRFDSGACLADFDRARGVDVNDIFTYLGAWFARDPRANADANTSVDVNDIFAFLGAWFVGCR